MNDLHQKKDVKISKKAGVVEVKVHTMCARVGGILKENRWGDIWYPALEHDMWVDIEGVISVTFTGLIKLPLSWVVLIYLQLKCVTLSYVLHLQQLLR